MSRRLSEEDGAEITRLFRVTAADLYAFACTLPAVDRPMAEDLVQEAFRAAVAAWGTLAGRSDEGRRRWLFTVVRNKTISQWRKDRNTVTSPDPPERPAFGDSTADQVLSATAAAKCWKVIEGMPPVRQKVAFLRWNEEWTSAEIASWLGITQATVRGHLRDARKDLRGQAGADVPFITDPEIDEGG